MLAIGDLPLVGFLALGDDDIIVFLAGDGFDPVDHLGEKVVIDIANDHPDGLALSSLQALGDRVWLVFMLAGIGDYRFFRFPTDLMTAPQGLGNGGDG